MRHRRHKRRLGLVTERRRALLRHLVIALVRHSRITTTLARAKEASKLADRMVTVAKQDSLHARRQIVSALGSRDATQRLMTVIAPAFLSTPGGYTRILRVKHRNGDGASLALLEFTKVFEVSKKAKAKPSPKEKVAPPPVESTPEKSVKKEEQKKGGFLSGLRRFLKGDE